jgi:hypothetical protein
VTPVTDERLGRLIRFDERSRNFPVRALLTVDQLRQPRSYTWKPGPVLDQTPDRSGQHAGSCVGHAYAGDLMARPGVLNADEALAYFIYSEAQLLDPWEGNYEGTSVLAGAQVCQRYGWMVQYRWVFGGASELASAVGFGGPAIIGIPWFESMFRPDSDGYVVVNGGMAGGHALLVYGVDVAERSFILRNSWGDWGKGGDCLMTWDTMDRLLADDGEALVPIQRARFAA